MLQPGQPAPAFTADSTKGPIDLADHLGKRPIVLIFYPKDETLICTKQLCAVRDSAADYGKLDALVIGVNPASMEAHQRFAGKHLYDFPLVTDTEERINRLYDVGRPTLLPFLWQRRIVYAIDRHGKIVFAKSGNRPTREILHALEGAK